MRRNRSGRFLNYVHGFHYTDGCLNQLFYPLLDTISACLETIISGAISLILFRLSLPSLLTLPINASYGITAVPLQFDLVASSWRCFSIKD